MSPADEWRPERAHQTSESASMVRRRHRLGASHQPPSGENLHMAAMAGRSNGRKSAPSAALAPIYGPEADADRDVRPPAAVHLRDERAVPWVSTDYSVLSADRRRSHGARSHDADAQFSRRIECTESKSRPQWPTDHPPGNWTRDKSGTCEWPSPDGRRRMAVAGADGFNESRTLHRRPWLQSADPLD